jgi:hypothetical protein
MWGVWSVGYASVVAGEREKSPGDSARREKRETSNGRRKEDRKKEMNG